MEMAYLYDLAFVENLFDLLGHQMLNLQADMVKDCACNRSFKEVSKPSKVTKGCVDQHTTLPRSCHH